MIHLKAKRQWSGIILLLFISISISCMDGLRLAAQKCEEYRSYTTDTYWLIKLMWGAPPIKVESANCSKLDQLIVGGVEAKYGEFPHHALLGYPKKNEERKYDFLCGGTLISERHVMTAAHCFSIAQPTVVRLGEYDTLFQTGDEYDVDIDVIRKHPQYKNREVYHDIALVKLANDVFFTRFIHPACLWDTEERNVTKYIATGFGYNDTFDGVSSSTMMKVQLDEFPVEDCAKAIGIKFDRRFPRGMQHGQLCVGSKSEGRDTCQGDSGGPLQTLTTPNTCTYHVVGITSIGSTCGIGNLRPVLEVELKADVGENPGAVILSAHGPVSVISMVPGQGSLSISH